MVPGCRGGGRLGLRTDQVLSEGGARGPSSGHEVGSDRGLRAVVANDLEDRVASSQGGGIARVLTLHAQELAQAGRRREGRGQGERVSEPLAAAQQRVALEAHGGRALAKKKLDVGQCAIEQPWRSISDKKT